MRSEPTLISVIMPVYNGATFVAQAIESALGQTYAPLEIIVVDDGSTDASARIVQGFGDKLTYIYQPNRGPAAARNRGLRIARGALIAFLDADDLWPAGKLAHQFSRLAADAALEVVLGHTQFMQQADEPGEALTFLDEPYPQYLLGSALFRRSAFARVGEFDETLRYCDDWDWFLRAQDLQVSMQMDQEVALYYRRHRDNLTASPQSRRELLQLLQKGLARRRSQDSERFALPEWFASARRTNADG